MAYETKDNTFTLFVNDTKGNEKAPTYKGKGLFNGEEIKIAIWKKTAKSGIEYLSGTIEKNEKPAEISTTIEKPIEEVTADEIPFNEDR